MVMLRADCCVAYVTLGFYDLKLGGLTDPVLH